MWHLKHRGPVNIRPTAQSSLNILCSLEGFWELRPRYTNHNFIHITRHDVVAKRSFHGQHAVLCDFSSKACGAVLIVVYAASRCAETGAAARLPARIRPLQEHGLRWRRRSVQCSVDTGRSSVPRAVGGSVCLSFTFKTHTQTHT